MAKNVSQRALMQDLFYSKACCKCSADVCIVCEAPYVCKNIGTYLFEQQVSNFLEELIVLATWYTTAAVDNNITRVITSTYRNNSNKFPHANK